MKQENVIQTKSLQFAIRIVRLYSFLAERKKEFILSKQILRSVTSIGANVEEAVGGQSKRDFLSIITIACEEARETKYWLRLLTETNYLDKKGV